LPTPEVSLPQVSIPEVSIIVPARNEEASLGGCLESLTAQTGAPFEIIVVDDASTDRTREIAQGFAGVRVISPELMPQDCAGRRWTGKSNALVAGAKAASAQWLLFTDADTVHLPGSLARALEEAKNERADLLSYSPEQVVVTFAERAVMPVIFAELAAHYPPRKVRDQNSAQSSKQSSRQDSKSSTQGSGIVAANGQYILVRRSAYDAVGGHAAVATEILEDVALARLFRNAGQRLYFRYGGDAVRTRMYRNWAQLSEGWTKNLALLFPRPGRLALQSVCLWFAAWFTIALAAIGALSRHIVWIAAAAFCLLLYRLLVYRRIRAAHFTTVNNLLAISVGLPMFAYLLLRSKKAHANGQVTWKGRTYSVDAPRGSTPAGMQTAKPIPRTESHGWRIEAKSQEPIAKS